MHRQHIKEVKRVGIQQVDGRYFVKWREIGTNPFAHKKGMRSITKDQNKTIVGMQTI